MSTGAPIDQATIASYLEDVKRLYPEFANGWKIETINSRLADFEAMPGDVSIIAQNIKRQSGGFYEHAIEKAVKQVTTNCRAPGNSVFVRLAKAGETTVLLIIPKMESDTQ